EGDASGSMFIVEEGRLRVWERQGERQRAKAFLRKGDLLGELSIARNQPRRATVEAITECRLIEISERTFGKLYARFSEFRKKIEERIASYDYKKTARLPLDFAQEILPANAAPIEQVSPTQLDEPATDSNRGPFESDG